MGSTNRVRSPRFQRDFNNILEGFESAFMGPNNIGGETLTEGENRIGRLTEAIQNQSLQMTREFAPKFQDLFSDLRQKAIDADPLARIAQQGLEGLEDGGLPDDVRRSILEETRSNAALRGTIDSPTSALSEIARLAGGTESFRQSRLAQAQSILGSPVAGSFGGGVGPQLVTPSTEMFGGLLGQSFGQSFQGNLVTNQIRNQQQIALGQGIGDLAGAIIGAKWGGKS